VIVSLEEYQATLELNQQLRKLLKRAADALEVLWPRRDDLIAELRKAAE
jgi:hypothetical protein